MFREYFGYDFAGQVPIHMDMYIYILRIGQLVLLLYKINRQETNGET